MEKLGRCPFWPKEEAAVLCLNETLCLLIWIHFLRHVIKTLLHETADDCLDWMFQWHIISSTATFKERTIISPVTEIIERSFCYNLSPFFIPMAHVLLQWVALCFATKWRVDGDAVRPGMGLKVPGCSSVCLGAPLPKQQSFPPPSLFILIVKACWTCVPIKAGFTVLIRLLQSSTRLPSQRPGKTWLHQLPVF